MFNFLGFGSTASAAGGVAVGAGITHLIHSFTTGKTVQTLTNRLGNQPLPAQERARKKIAILKALAYKDGDFSVHEQVFMYRYILTCPDLPTDVKVELAQQLQEPLPTAISHIWQKLRSLVQFNDLFVNEEDAAGFVNTMVSLAQADGVVDASEIAYIKSVCCDCKIAPRLLPHLEPTCTIGT